MINHHAGARVLLLSIFLSCSSEKSDPDEAERLATELALQQYQVQQETKQTMEESTPAPEAPVQKINNSNEAPAEILYQWKGISGLHQSFFTDSSATAILENGLRGLPSPVPVEIRWLTTSESGDLGMGEIALTYEKGVSSLDELQWAANVLLKYRNNVGNFFDMRILSFNLVIESIDCRVDIISKVSMDVALLSPCIRQGDKSLCATVSQEGRSYSPEMKKMISSCFPD